MTKVLIRHRVHDYPKWKAEFDKFVNTRRSGGEKSFSIMHPSNDPHDLVLLFEWDRVENARTFFESSELQSAMERAGVAEKPAIQFLLEEDNGKL